MPWEHEELHCCLAKGDDNDNRSASASSATTECHDGSDVITLEEVNAMTQIIFQEEEKSQQVLKKQQLAEKTLMESRREVLRHRVASMRHLPVSREPIYDDSSVGGTAHTSSVTIQQDDLFSGADTPHKKRMRAVLPWQTRLWHSVYNATRFVVVSMSYIPVVSLFESHAPREYYQQEMYD